MDNEERKAKVRALEKRTRQFAIRIIELANELPETQAGKTVAQQIIKSGTSIGANYREANRARSWADFKSKIDIVVQEAAETQYWLEVIVEAEMLSWDWVQCYYEECSELLAIFTAVSHSTSKNPKI